MSKGTSHRTVRIDDELWDEAREIAKENGDNLSDIIRNGLRAYIITHRRLIDGPQD